MELVSRVYSTIESICLGRARYSLNRESFHEQCCFASYQMEALVQAKIRKARSFSLDPFPS